MQRITSAGLTAAERDAYQKHGYLVRPGAFEPDEVRDIRAACEELVEKLVQSRHGERVTFGSYVFDTDAANKVIIKWEGDSDVVHGLEPFAHLSDELKFWAYDPRLVEPAGELLGVDGPELFTEKLNLKRPRVGGVNPLHQDYPYWLRSAEDATQIVTAMLFLDDANRDNGCLQVVPGSHVSGAWQGRRDGDRFAANEIDVSAYPDVKPVPLEVPAGSVVLFGPFLVHQSAPNTSQHERRALLYSYQPPGRRTQLDALSARLG